MFHVIWRNCENEIKSEQSKTGQITNELSILKMANFFRKYFTELITSNLDKNMIKQIKIHCAYEKRKDRDNAREALFKLAA